MIRRRSFTCLIVCSLLATPLYALTSKVVLLNGGTVEQRERVSASLTNVMNSLDRELPSELKKDFSTEGLKNINDLIVQTHPVSVNPLYEANLISFPGRGWEVRNLKVLVDMKGLAGNPYQQLVFSLDENLLITDVKFCLEQQQYERIFPPGSDLKDVACREQILQFLEIFLTAYNRKEIDLLKQVYSDDALIIVGKVITTKAVGENMLDRSHLTKDRIQFIRQSKQTYLAKLEKVFERNEYIKVGFFDIEVRRHPKIDLIYGVTLMQDWRTSSYSDTGWLFLMIDFRDPNQPLIHVRSWQPERFKDGSVVSLGDFEIIE